MTEEYQAYDHLAGDLSPEVREKFFSFATETDVKIAELKDSLLHWRELLLPIYSILHWEKQWHPFSIVGCISSFFMLLWLLEPSLLTTLSLLCLTITLSEFIVPYLSSSLLKQEQWTAKHDEKYDLICRSIVITREKCFITYRSFCLMKITRPNLYYVFLISGLLVLAWIGNNVDNMLLTYLAVTVLSLLPGLEKSGTLFRCGYFLSDKIAELATSSHTAALKKGE